MHTKDTGNLAMSKEHYPAEEALGENCMFWRLEDPQTGCCFPKAELMGRVTCEGMIDDICLFIKDNRTPSSLTQEQALMIKTGKPELYGRPDLPPGNIY